MNATPRALRATLLVVAMAVFVGCSGAAASPSPAVTPAPSPSPGVTPAPSPSPSPTAIEVTSAAQAAALVIASDERFASIGPVLPDVIGQSAWYEASDLGDRYSVSITIGSGDCMAGCINRHIWHYSVTHDGTITLESEEGDEVEGGGGSGTSQPATIDIMLSAGPICPVVQDPPDPNCADRPVVNAEVVLRDAAGNELGRGASDPAGQVRFQVPAGAYYVEVEPVEGLMGQPEPVAFGVLGGDALALRLMFDTGIR